MATKKKSIKSLVKNDTELSVAKGRLKLLERKYKELVAQIQSVSRENNVILKTSDKVRLTTIKPKLDTGKSESTAFLIASDWHVEERVDPKVVSGLNKYDIALAKERGYNFFKNGLRLTNIIAQDTNVNTLVLALLGDFFSNDIHDELVETNQLSPMEAVLLAQNIIASGIQFLLDNSKVDIILPCHSGNHARTTKKVHVSTEAGHSLEYVMYYNLKNHFRDNPRVKFIIADGYHTYLKVYDQVVRFHHGHMVKYGGGVGGIYIPVNKAIAQWNKAKPVDLDVFGHFHQFRDGGNFICNGSLIGYNAYALSIKAEYERPQQAFFVIHKTKGRTFVAPVLVE